MTPELETFFWAFGANMAVELLDIQTSLKTGSRLPVHHRTRIYWVVCLILASVAGFLAIAHNIKGNPLLAINIGVATPIILRSLGKRMRY